jgi:predicted RNA-binding Zn-ribbon protein involved in translation (DUF1610 family)
MVAGAILMETLKAKCPKCGKTYQLRSKQDSVICDCWQICPTCGEEMTPYTPDTAPKTYGLEGLREMQGRNGLHPPPSPFLWHTKTGGGSS